MPRGAPVPEGTERVDQNGYTWIKCEIGQRLKHHLVAEEKLGRAIDTAVERVCFVDGNKKNFDPDNIEVVLKKHPRSKEERIEALRAQLEELEAS